VVFPEGSPGNRNADPCGRRVVSGMPVRGYAMTIIATASVWP
jgi:hypothetical protein